MEVEVEVEVEEEVASSVVLAGARTAGALSARHLRWRPCLSKRFWWMGAGGSMAGTSLAALAAAASTVARLGHLFHRGCCLACRRDCSGGDGVHYGRGVGGFGDCGVSASAMSAAGASTAVGHGLGAGLDCAVSTMVSTGVWAATAGSASGGRSLAHNGLYLAGRGQEVTMATIGIQKEKTA